MYPVHLSSLSHVRMFRQTLFPTRKGRSFSPRPKILLGRLCILSDDLLNSLDGTRRAIRWTGPMARMSPPCCVFTSHRMTRWHSYNRTAKTSGTAVMITTKVPSKWVDCTPFTILLGNRPSCVPRKGSRSVCAYLVCLDKY